jgi:hypothetical protein
MDRVMTFDNGETDGCGERDIGKSEGLPSS